MIQEQSYQRKFELLRPWAYEILNEVKKEIRGEHLPKNPSFVQKHFQKRNLAKLTFEELAKAYVQEINEGSEEIGEWVASRWILRNADIYHFFAEELAKVNPNFDEIENLSPEVEKRLVQTSGSRFSYAKTYIFSVLNSVIFSLNQFQELRCLAEKELIPQHSEPLAEESVQEVKKKHADELARLQEKYEKKVEGLLKKYQIDVEGYKKQLGQLQRKLSTR